MNIGEMRNYEVSLWTLQDEFITVLKWSDVEQVGRILEPKLELNVDGTLKFTFSIPMYLNKWIEGMDGKAQLTENPIWYREDFNSLDHNLPENMQSISFNEMNWREIEKGNLITSMRKIKVIFDKFNNEDDKNIFEFVITKVTEEHLDEKLMCNVECEGLAFHELGKIGYKINLSLDNFELTYKEYSEEKHWTKKDGTICSDQPIQNVLYWCDLCGLPPLPEREVDINPNLWYYTIEMNWDTSSNSNEPREKGKVYENSYTSAWSVNELTNTLTPKVIEGFREKARPVEVENSNLYNITLTIAENFGIYCRYDYKHDYNNHIIGRTVVFFNNYMNENVVSFTYPHSSKNIKRELDGTELTTKMYIVPLEDNTVLGGLITIADAPANASGEDYLLNFDYMYMIGAITKELYDAIEPYKVSMHKFNEDLTNYLLHKTAEEDLKVDLEAKITVLENELAPVLELIDYASLLYNAIDMSDGVADGYFSRDGANHYKVIVRNDHSGGANPLYIEFTDLGIDSSNVHVYKNYSSATTTLSDELTIVLFIHGEYHEVDEHGNTVYNDATGAYISGLDVKELDTVHVEYKYLPRLYYQRIIDVYTKKRIDIATELDTHRTNLEACESRLETYTNFYKEVLVDKEEAIKTFESFMGPALREGYWQTDDYKDYGELKEETVEFSMTYEANVINNDAGDGIIFAWDTEPFENENKLYYEEKITLEKHYYPCIDLSRFLDFVASIIPSNKRVSFIFNNNYNKELTPGEKNLLLNISNFTVGGKAEFGFLKIDSTTIKPVLILTGAKTMSDELVSFMLTSGNPRICVFDTLIDNSNGSILVIISDDDRGHLGAYTVTASDIYWEPSKIITSGFAINDIKDADIEMVYPRIKFSDLRLKPYDTTLIIKYGTFILQKYYDYSLLTRNTRRVDVKDQVHEEATYQSYLEYFATLKPETVLKYKSFTMDLNNDNLPDKDITVNYVLSNAATSIYLDGEEVLHDSAFPRVSYEIEVSLLLKYALIEPLDDESNFSLENFLGELLESKNGIFLRKFAKELYKKLTQLIMINDVDLKLSNVFGYISGVHLDLDQPQNDTIEVKNYSTKFEDLFSTIVASTEAMRRNLNALAAAAMGNVALTGDALSNTLSNSTSILLAYLDSHFDSSAVVKARLAEIFSEAGKILSDANKSLNGIMNLNLKNASILGGFVSAILDELTPKLYTGQNLPKEFKVGDIWVKTDATGKVVGSYVSTTSSTSRDGGGFTRTYDGTLAAITGASMNIDAVAGTMELLAANRLDIKSGGNLYIAADDKVDIVGNREVNIGGTTINIGSTVTAEDTLEFGGINIVATRYANVGNLTADFYSRVTNPISDNLRDYYLAVGAIDSVEYNDSTQYYGGFRQVKEEEEFDNLNEYYTFAGTRDAANILSKVLIHPGKIELGSADILMRGSNIIQMVTSRNTISSTSAIELSPENGVWIGSGKGIVLFSGGFAYNAQTNILDKGNISGASIELNSEHLLLGYSNVSSGRATAIELNDSHVIIATGGSLTHDQWNKNGTYSTGKIVIYNQEYYKSKNNHTENGSWNESNWDVYKINGTSSGLVGARFTRDSIGLATLNGNSINAILMDGNGITFGSGSIDVTLPTTGNSGNNLRAGTGSYTRINLEGIELGSLADLYINTDNFKLLTHSRDKGKNQDFNEGSTVFAIGSNLLSVDYDTQYDTRNNKFKDKNGNEINATVNLLVNKNGLYVNGNVYAEDGVFNGKVYASEFVAKGLHTMRVNSEKFGFYTTATNESGEDPILTIDANGYITATTNLYIEAPKLWLGTKDSNNNITYKSFTKTLQDVDKSITDKTKSGNDALALALRIVRGELSVPHVATTGIEITEQTLTLTATDKMILASNGLLYITNYAGNNLIALTLAGMTLASKANLAIASGSSIQIFTSKSGSYNAIELGEAGITLLSSAGININSTGYLNVLTANVVIDSLDANNDGITVDVKTALDNSNTSFLRVHKNYGGFFGGWNFNRGWFWSGKADDCVCICGLNEMTPETTWNQFQTDWYNAVKAWAFYCGLSWPEGYPSGSHAPFRVSKHGNAYVKGLFLGFGPDAGVPKDSGGQNYVGTMNFWIQNSDGSWGWAAITSTEVYKALKSGGGAASTAVVPTNTGGDSGTGISGGGTGGGTGGNATISYDYEAAYQLPSFPADSEWRAYGTGADTRYKIWNTSVDNYYGYAWIYDNVTYNHWYLFDSEGYMVAGLTCVVYNSYSGGDGLHKYQFANDGTVETDLGKVE